MCLVGEEYDPIENSIKILRSNSSIEINFLYEVNIDHVDGTRAIAELTPYTREELREGEPFSNKTNGNSFLFNLRGLVDYNYEIDYVAACKERLDEIKETGKSFQRVNYYEDIRPLIKFLLTNEIKERIKESVNNLKSWLTTIYADSNFPKGIPFILNLYIKSLGNNDSYLVEGTTTMLGKAQGYDKNINSSNAKQIHDLLFNNPFGGLIVDIAGHLELFKETDPDKFMEKYTEFMRKNQQELNKASDKKAEYEKNLLENAPFKKWFDELEKIEQKRLERLSEQKKKEQMAKLDIKA